MPNNTKGLIIKALGGFYYVQTKNEVIECRARGAFRKAEISPYVGDNVTIELTQDGKGYIMDIDERVNSLIRPPVANIDRLAMVISTTQPAPNTLVIDKLCAVAQQRDINVVIIFTKIDMADYNKYKEIYKTAGYDVYAVDNLQNVGIDDVKQLLSTGITAFSGNSGAGKSSLLNALYPNLGLSTGEISKKLGRGRHTTRHVQLYPTGTGGYIADTPGFSAVDFLQFGKLPADQLEHCFIEFLDFIGKCRYTGCSHTTEQDCAILSAVANGEIPKSRHVSYCSIYNDLKQVKPWEK